MSNRPIGVYDSGIGGLTVLAELMKVLPNETFVYYADRKNMPYGEKSEEQITQFSADIVESLRAEYNTKLIIAACHTSSAIALPKIKNNYDCNIIDVIHPAIDEIKQYKSLGVLATEASIKSHYHKKLFSKYCQVHEVPCYEFVKIIETQILNHELLFNTAAEYLKTLPQDVDAIFYGCTHYPLISDIIARVMPNVKHINPAKAVAQSAKKYLLDLKIDNNSFDSNKGKDGITNIDFVCTKDKTALIQKAEYMLRLACSLNTE